MTDSPLKKKGEAAPVSGAPNTGMSQTIQIAPEDRLLITRIDGLVTAEDVIDSFDRAVADPAFDPSYDDLVVEGPDCDLSDLTADVIPRIVAAHDAALQAHPRFVGAYCRTAVFTQPTVNRPLLALMTALWETHGAVVDDMKICATLEEAAAWLDRPAERLRALIDAG